VVSEATEILEKLQQFLDRTGKDYVKHEKLATILKWCNRLNLPKEVCYDAVYIYSKRGYEGVTTAVACIYVAATKHGVKVSKRLAYVITGIRFSTIKNIINKLMKLEGVSEPTVEEITRKAVKTLGLGPEVEEKALALYREAREKANISGAQKRSIIAACIYAATESLGLKATQLDVARATGTTEVTLRKWLQRLPFAWEILRESLKNDAI
jgi:transcription initiation factor TFIIIB Brf1 subunit/transcription initiation factor TFIIB